MKGLQRQISSTAIILLLIAALAASVFLQVYFSSAVVVTDPLPPLSNEVHSPLPIVLAGIVAVAVPIAISFVLDRRFRAGSEQQ